MSLFNKCRKVLDGFSPLTKYLTYSVFVTILDVLTVWVLVRLFHVDLVISNTAGVIFGFIIHYVLSSKSVFNTDFGVSGFLIYLVTFIGGLYLANWIIVFCNDHVFYLLGDNLRLLMSKGISVVIPFFVLYGIRKICYDMLARYMKRG